MSAQILISLLSGECPPLPCPDTSSRASDEWGGLRSMDWPSHRLRLAVCPCAHCGTPATYCRAVAGVWRDFGIARSSDGSVVPLVPGQQVLLCEECAGAFDPRCTLPWNAPLWVVSVLVSLPACSRPQLGIC